MRLDRLDRLERLDYLGHLDQVDPLNQLHHRDRLMGSVADQQAGSNFWTRWISGIIWIMSDSSSASP